MENNEMNETTQNETTEVEELSQFFDETEFLEQEIIPRLKELQRLCRSREIPFMAAACYASKEMENGSVEQKISHAVYFNGERVPDKFSVADLILEEKLNRGALLGVIMRML